MKDLVSIGNGNYCYVVSNYVGSKAPHALEIVRLASEPAKISLCVRIKGFFASIGNSFSRIITNFFAKKTVIHLPIDPQSIICPDFKEKTGETLNAFIRNNMLPKAERLYQKAVKETKRAEKSKSEKQKQEADEQMLRDVYLRHGHS